MKFNWVEPPIKLARRCRTDESNLSPISSISLKPAAVRLADNVSFVLSTILVCLQFILYFDKSVEFTIFLLQNELFTVSPAYA